MPQNDDAPISGRRKGDKSNIPMIPHRRLSFLDGRGGGMWTPGRVASP